MRLPKVRGYDYAGSQLKEVMKEARGSGISAKAVLHEATAVDANNGANHYLSRAELDAALERLQSGGQAPAGTVTPLQARLGGAQPKTVVVKYDLFDSPPEVRTTSGGTAKLSPRLRKLIAQTSHVTPSETAEVKRAAKAWGTTPAVVEGFGWALRDRDVKRALHDKATEVALDAQQDPASVIWKEPKGDSAKGVTAFHRVGDDAWHVTVRCMWRTDSGRMKIRDVTLKTDDDGAITGVVGKGKEKHGTSANMIAELLTFRSASGTKEVHRSVYERSFKDGPDAARLKEVWGDRDELARNEEAHLKWVARVGPDQWLAKIGINFSSHYRGSFSHANRPMRTTGYVMLNDRGTLL